MADNTESVGREVILATFVDTLGDYIDARIYYYAADPEFRSSREVAQAADRLEKVLEEVLHHE